MDGSHFDALTRTLTARLSRRVTLRGLTTGLLLSLGLALDEHTILAKKKKKKSKKKKDCPQGRDRCGNRCCRPGQSCQGGQCLCAFGRPACGNTCCLLEETCQGGRCRHRCEDGVQNAGESDTDCGRVCDGVLGTSPFGRCGLRKRCAGNDDCRSALCREPQPGAGLQCVECESDSHCTSPIFRRCLDNFCFECALDDDCASGGPGTPPLCVVIQDCPRNQPCVCRECRQDSDCPPQRPHCNTGTDSIRGKFCNQCLEDEHCPEGQLCDQVSGKCEGFECTTNRDCPSGEACVSGACSGTCLPSGAGCDNSAGACTTCCSGVGCTSSGSAGPVCCNFDQTCSGAGGACA